MAYCYSIENGVKGLHIHFMLVLETCSQALNPATAFYHKVKPAIETLRGVKWCNLAGRKTAQEECLQAPYHHNLNKYYEFKDALYRYSYLAKTNDKQGIPSQLRKTFATSIISHHKYYYFSGINNMLKIKETSQNTSLKSFAHTKADTAYKHLRQLRHDENEVKQVFHFEDLSTNQLVGFYGLTHSIDYSYGDCEVIISLDSLYCQLPLPVSDSTPADTAEGDWLDYFYLHLEEQVRKIFSAVDHKSPQIITTCEDEDFLELLDLAVNAAHPTYIF